MDEKIKNQAESNKRKICFKVKNTLLQTIDLVLNEFIFPESQKQIYFLMNNLRNKFDSSSAYTHQT
mgnify:CR=1 FL=1